MEKGGPQLFIFPDESGDLNEQKVIKSKKLDVQEELTAPEKIQKEMLFTNLRKLEKEHGELNNNALRQGGYFQEKSKFIAREIKWINEFVGKDIVQVSSLDEERMTYSPHTSEEAA